MLQTLGRLTVALAGLLLVVPMAYAAPGYQHFVVGNPADVVTTTTPLLVLQGGGTDVDENFVRMGAAAGGGDFVVIRASGTDAYNPYILRLVRLRLRGDHHLQEPQRGLRPLRHRADPQRRGAVHRRRRPVGLRALWKNTPVEDAINYAGQREEGPRRRDQRRHGHPERVPVLGHEQQQPHLGRRPWPTPSTAT